MLARAVLCCLVALGAAPAFGADVSGGYVQGPGGYYNPADRSGPYTIDGSGKAQILGSVAPQASAVPNGGLSVYRVNNPGTAAGMTVKASPGRLYSFNLCNSASAARYVRFYDSAAPVPGTSPVYAGAIVISAGSCQQFTTNFGLAFAAGIGMGITAANGDTDTTAPTAGDVTGFVGFM